MLTNTMFAADGDGYKKVNCFTVVFAMERVLSKVGIFLAWRGQ